MKITFDLDGAPYGADLSVPIDISIPIVFGGEGPNAFYLPRAEAVVAEGGDFIGDTRRGGSCNCETITLNPHGNGTHTECVGHISLNRVSIADALKDVLIPSLLLSIDLEEDGSGGACIGRRALESALERAAIDRHPSNLPGLLLRTLPNDESKRTRVWSGNNPPYVGPEAAQLIRDLGVRHLLVDLPSLDREDDPMLTAHRIFWEASATGTLDADPEDSRTITEMIFIPDSLHDGIYLASIQIPPFVLDAAPSRVLIYPLGAVADRR